MVVFPQNVDFSVTKKRAGKFGVLGGCRKKLPSNTTTKKEKKKKKQKDWNGSRGSKGSTGKKKKIVHHG